MLSSAKIPRAKSDSAGVAEAGASPHGLPTPNLRSAGEDIEARMASAGLLAAGIAPKMASAPVTTAPLGAIPCTGIATVGLTPPNTNTSSSFTPWPSPCIPAPNKAAVVSVERSKLYH